MLEMIELVALALGCGLAMWGWYLLACWWWPRPAGIWRHRRG